uniref:Serine (or cysteine) peptidase inhibitor, clade A (alpha-1 antiproteinase, antitrypsin), member 12 n=1 Tax=Jaculus jaculus TaxID=51337 RepID=A0A8C5K6C9_JACJA|nr:serpin A12 [Jaculus jaculus]
MNPTLGLGLFLAGLLAVKGLQQAKAPPRNQKTPNHSQDWRNKEMAWVLAQHNLNFGFKLFQKLAAHNPGKNIFFSPLSISTAFSMLCLGAQNATLAEIKKGFDFQDMSDRDLHLAFHYLLRRLNKKTQDLQLELGNTLFIDEKLKPRTRFLRQAKSVYNADTVLTNFKSLDDTQRQINSYISQKTQGRIRNLIRNIDPGTVMILANYIFFRARWKYEFDPKETKQEDFFVEGKKPVKVPMMFHGGMYDMAYDKKLACTILEMPYKDNITATFILPDDGKLQLLEQGLQVHIFAKWKSLLSKRVVDVHLPRLHISGAHNLKKVLSGLGISKVFEEHGDLSRISSHRSLKVGEAIHKAELKLDEKGTEGSAGTGAQTLPMENPEIIKMNKSFLFMLYENSMPSMIFLARVYDPSGK